VSAQHLPSTAGGLRKRAASPRVASNASVAKAVEALKTEGADDILVVNGGVILPKDHDFPKKAGVSAINRPGINIPEPPPRSCH
jgi:methylmalonyl-CoA mutase